MFPAPVRAALAATTYEEARRISLSTSGKGMTRQTFAIAPKIREVDNLLRGSRKAQRMVREIHPEICFWALAEGKPLRHGKKTAAGIAERLALLEGVLPSVPGDLVQIRGEFRSRDVAHDDILDAMAAAITASADPAALRTLPTYPPTDSAGLPMEIVYAVDDSFAT